MNLLLFKNSLRFLLKKKNYLTINLLGLGIGIASFLILFLYVYNDFTYNHFNKNMANIYRVRENSGTQTKGLFLPKILEQVPEVINGTRIFDWEGFRVNYENIEFQENIKYADTGFFSVFSFPFVEGPVNNGINDKYGVVVSREFAHKYFGNSSALGKKLQVRFDNTFLQVNGVVDIPQNSSVKFDLLASYETGEQISPWINGVHDWYNTFSTTYLLLKEGTNPESIYDKLQQIANTNFQTGGGKTPEINLLAFSDYHSSEESNQTLIIILSIIAVGILGIAIVNFINLTITNSLSRGKEIGIKKVVGAGRGFMFRQIIAESLMVAFLAILIACFLTVLFLPTFNQLFNTHLHFNIFSNSILISLLIVIWLFVGTFAGLASALMSGQTQILQSLRGQLGRPGKVSMARYSLVAVQFMIAIMLISGTFLVRKQINFMINHDPKFDKENVVVAQLESWQFPNPEAASAKYKLIAENLRKSPYVESVCFSQATPGNYQSNYNNFYPENDTDGTSIHLRKAYVGRNYLKTFGLELIEGKGFGNDEMNYKNCVVLNKTAMKMLGYASADEQTIHEGSASGEGYRIIGEVDDFSYQGVQHAVEPLAHFYVDMDDYTNWSYLSVKSKPGMALQVIERLKNEWKTTQPASSVSYFFANDKLNEQYKEYMKVNQIVAGFSFIAIALSCIGLFALSAYAISRRNKEVGIRKVNGAKIGEVIAMLNKEFLLWVVLAVFIAIPLSWYGLNKWLESFALKTTLGWWIFALSGFTVLIIALLTVSWQSWKAATRNPVEALRYE